MIAEFRAAVHRTIVEQDLLPSRPYVPDDFAELPCAIVAGVVLSDGDPGTFDLELPLLVLGRRIDDDDAQAELDRLTDALILVFGGTKGRHAHEHYFAVTSAQPRLFAVAGTDVPGYEITITTTTANC